MGWSRVSTTTASSIVFALSTLSAAITCSSCSITTVLSRLSSHTQKNPLQRLFMATYTSSSSFQSSCSETFYVDVHAHVFHEQFIGEDKIIAEKCIAAGINTVVVNGLNPESNRRVLELCKEYPTVYKAAVGIYPLDAACNVITKEYWNHEFDPPSPFDVDAEIDWIDEMARTKQIIAVGECGLDWHYLADEASKMEQERVLRKLMRVAKEHDLPIILHTRKAEQRVLDMLLEEKVVKADFHCFGGKTKLGVKIAEAGYYLSIPTGVERMAAFQGLAKALPSDKILTETDCPYMGPDKDERNDPSTIPRGVAAIAKARGVGEGEMMDQIRSNYFRLFGCSS